MRRLILLPVLCCALCVGCGESPEENAGGNDPAAGTNSGTANGKSGSDAGAGTAPGIVPMPDTSGTAGVNAGDRGPGSANTGGATPGGTTAPPFAGSQPAPSSNPITNLFRGLDRTAKQAGGNGQR